MTEFYGSLDDALRWAKEPGAKAARPAVKAGGMAKPTPAQHRWQEQVRQVQELRRDIDHLSDNFKCADPADGAWATRCIIGLQGVCDALMARLTREIVQ
jgi:hypothetical protein